MKSSLPHFSNETDGETSIFELGLILERVWSHKDVLDIMTYMTNPAYHSNTDLRVRADHLIYFALTTAAKKDSYAKLQIIAASNRDSIPCVLPNEGKKLYQMFQALFTMTNLHKASLPTIRAEFYNIKQLDNESFLQYTSRVDIIVSTLAKLGEQVSPGAWVYALGNGLQPKYTDSKAGILYNKEGFDTVLSVKKNLQSEEAVLKGATKLASKSSQRMKLHLNFRTTVPLVLPHPHLMQLTRHYTSKGTARATQRAKERTKVRADGLTSSLTGINGSLPTTASAITTITPLGSKQLKARVEAKGPTLPIKKNTGVRFINNSGTPLNGVMTIPTAQEGSPFPLRDHGAKEHHNRRANSKGKGNYGDRNWKSHNFPAAYSSEHATLLFTRNLERLKHKTGGTPTNSDRFSGITMRPILHHVTKRTLMRKLRLH